MIKKYIILLLLTSLWTKESQIINGYKYLPPKKFTFINSFSKDIYQYGQQTLKKEKINEWIILSALTGIMIAADEQLIVEAQKWGHKTNLSNKDNNNIDFVERLISK